MIRKISPGLLLNGSEHLPVLNRPRPRLTRREMVQRLFGGLGAAFALPGVALGHPVHRHLTGESFLAQADANAAAQDWKPEVLSSQENELFIALAERIVPNSTKAQVNRTVDLLLTVDTNENRKAFLDSLGAMDRESKARFGSAFPSLSAAQQDQLLTAASAEQSKTADHFENLKGWIVGAYYSSEIGMRELGWTDDYYYEWTGCEHEDEHQ